MPLQLGSASASKAYVDGTAVSKLYLGSSLVVDYTAGAPTRAFIRDVAVSQHVSTSGAAGAEVVTRPANVQAGDLLLLVVVGDTGATTAFTPPTGFAHPTGTAEQIAGSGLAVVSISQKVATASEPATYTHAAFSTTTDGVSVMYAIGNVGASTNTRVAVASSAASTTSATAPTVTPATAKNLQLVGFARDFGSGGAAGTVTLGATPAGYTLLRTDSQTGGLVWAFTHTRNYDSTTATGTQAFPYTVNPSTSLASVGFNIIIPSL